MENRKRKKQETFGKQIGVGMKSTLSVMAPNTMDYTLI